jgi:hypothetical protein
MGARWPLWALDRGGWTRRAAWTLILTEAEGGAAIADALREDRGRSQPQAGFTCASTIVWKADNGSGAVGLS